MKVTYISADAGNALCCYACIPCISINSAFLEKENSKLDTTDSCARCPGDTQWMFKFSNAFTQFLFSENPVLQYFVCTKDEKDEINLLYL